MLLSLTQAAQLLGKSRRQLEYQIQQGRLRASKVDGRWRIDESDLPLSPGQRQAMRRRADGLRQAAAEVLDTTAPRPRYSMTDLQAFATTRAIWRDAQALLPPEHEARGPLRAALDQIAVGCHRFVRHDKALAYHAGRDALATAACALLLDGSDTSTALAERIEQDASIRIPAGSSRPRSPPCSSVTGSVARESAPADACADGYGHGSPRQRPRHPKPCNGR